jgi:hypothetical protein
MSSPINAPHASTRGCWPYAKAKKFVRSLGLKSALEYQQWAAGKLDNKPARPREVPFNPHKAYLREWQGFSDWLGTDRIANFEREFLPYDQARAFVAQLGLETYSERRTYCADGMPPLGKRPAHIPSNPNLVYKHAGWCGIKHSGWVRAVQAWVCPVQCCLSKRRVHLRGHWAYPGNSLGGSMSPAGSPGSLRARAMCRANPTPATNTRAGLAMAIFWAQGTSPTTAKSCGHS